ncbi:MAG: IS1380 family transposase [Armatimonadota bacterium]
MRRGPKNLRIRFDAEALTHYGGAILIHQFLQRLGLRTQVWRHVRFSQRNNRYHISETLLAALYPVILGMERLGTTESLKHNGVFQYLTGLPGYPDPTSLRRFLHRFADAGRAGFLKVHDRYRQAMLTSLRRRPIVDLDASVLTVYGRQEKSAVGYNPRKRGRPSYLAVLCFEGHTRDCLDGALHPGNTHALKVIRPLVEQALLKLPSPQRLQVRADAAFGDGEFLQWLEDRRAHYVIPVRVTSPIKYRLGGFRYRRVRREVWTAEFRYQPQGWDQSRRFVVIRRPVPEEPSAQLHLFQMKGYTYQVLVTNMPWTPWRLWQFYNDRSHAELILRELKAAYALDKIPMHDFAGNEAFFQLVLLAYNLLSWFKRLCAPPRLQRATLQRLRRQLFLAPAQLVRPQGRPMLRLARAYPFPELFQQTLRRIHRLKSPLQDGA